MLAIFYLRIVGFHYPQNRAKRRLISKVPLSDKMPTYKSGNWLIIRFHENLVMQLWQCLGNVEMGKEIQFLMKLFCQY